MFCAFDWGFWKMALFKYFWLSNCFALCHGFKQFMCVCRLCVIVKDTTPKTKDDAEGKGLKYPHWLSVLIHLYETVLDHTHTNVLGSPGVQCVLWFCVCLLHFGR